MLMHEYLNRCEWELAREIERQDQLDPERAWRRLERAQTNFDPIVKGVGRGIQSLVAWTRHGLRTRTVLVDQRQAPRTTLQPRTD